MSRPLSLLILVALASPVAAREKTVDDRVAQFGDAVRERLAPAFAAAAIPYPPAKVTLIGLKQERLLELYAAGADGRYRLVRSYPILAASGDLGPKLKEGDLQVPEGLYRITSLNPNSRFHLSLRVGYPNAFDRAQARAENRTGLGGDIMIHGNAVSIGCLAMGDAAAEELFVLAAKTGLPNIRVILSPVDFREGKTVRQGPAAPPWLDRLYESIRIELGTYARAAPRSYRLQAPPR
jgi:hypothetical protein